MDKPFTQIMRQVVPPVALLLILLATIVPFALHTQRWAMEAYPWVYGAGALALLVSAFFQPRKGSLRLRRLRRLDAMAALIFLTGAFFLLYKQVGYGRDWIAFTLAGAAVKIYTTLVLPGAERREQQAEAEKKHK